MTYLICDQNNTSLSQVSISPIVGVGDVQRSKWSSSSYLFIVTVKGCTKKREELIITIRTLHYVFAAELYFFPDKMILNFFRI